MGAQDDPQFRVVVDDENAGHGHLPDARSSDLQKPAPVPGPGPPF
jgi:hypothetical protein